MIIDFHVHLFAAGHLPKRWFSSIAAHLAARKPGTVDQNALAQRLEARILDPDAAYLIKDMDDAKVDSVISHPLDYGLALGEPEASMEKIVEHNAALQARHPNRYFSFTSIDPRRPGAPEFVRATSRKYGLKGLNLYPPAGFDPASPECMKVCRIALEEDLPVLFHTGGANFPMKPRYGSPHLLGDVQAELPDLKIILGHAGFPYQWEEAITVARRNPEWLEKDLVDFHAIIEVPKGDKHPRFAHLPEIESFARSEKDRKLVTMQRAFRVTGQPFVLPPGTPKDRVEILQEAFHKTYRDPEFHKAYKKLAADDATPLMPEAHEKVIREIPRDPEVVEIFKKIVGAGPLPSR